MTDREPVRAIFASEFWSGASAGGLAPGLRASGWLVEEVDEQRFFLKSTNLFQKVEARVRAKQQIAAFQSAILAAAAFYRAQVMITVKGHYIQPATLKRLRAQGIFTVNYYPDYRFNDIAIERMKEYDLVVTTKSFHLDALHQLLSADRLAFLHHGYNSELHRPVMTSKAPKTDVLYVGNATQSKLARISALARALPDVKIKVVGVGWDEFNRGIVLQNLEVSPAVHGDFYAAEIVNAKIVLGFHMGVEASTGFEDLVSTRSFEIPACGGFMLHVDNAEVRSLYHVPDEIDTFGSGKELIAKIRYWLANPEKRAAVALRGHARAVPAYSYVTRGRELASLIESRMKAGDHSLVETASTQMKQSPDLHKALQTSINAFRTEPSSFGMEPDLEEHGTITHAVGCASDVANRSASIAARSVFASDFSYASAARGIVNGLRASGWLINEVDRSIFTEPPYSITARIENRLRKHGQAIALQAAILRSSLGAGSDLFLTIKGHKIRSKTLSILRSRGVYCVNYYPDYHFNDVPISAMANYDLVITTKSFQLQALTELLGADRVGFVHHGYGDEIHRPLVQAQQPVDVLYIGNPTAPKVALLSALVSALPDVRFRVCGARWRTLVRSTPLERIEIGNAPHGDYYAAEIGAAKITLSFHMGVDKATGFEDQVSMRSFEIPACGGFMMHIDNPEVRTLYEVGQEIDVFADVDDLVRKIGYWLAHPDERRAVAARGYSRAAPAYGYAQRGREIAALVAERRAAR